jgi:hypothetical protein
MRGFLWGFGLANCLWAAGALWLQIAKTTLLMWGQPGDAAGAIIMAAILAVAVAIALVSSRARDTLVTGSLLILWAGVWARQVWL